MLLTECTFGSSRWHLKEKLSLPLEPAIVNRQGHIAASSSAQAPPPTATIQYPGTRQARAPRSMEGHGSHYGRDGPRRIEVLDSDTTLNRANSKTILQAAAHRVNSVVRTR